MALYLSKMVVLQNDMLARCYLVLCFLTAGAMFSWFYLSGGYLMSVSLRHTARMNMWVNAPDDGALNDTLLAHQGDVCGSPSDYDYWWSEQWQYNGSKCIEVSSMCNPLFSTCLRTNDIYVKESPREIFLTTWAETYRQRPTGEIEEPFRFYIPQVNAFSVSFSYSFSVPQFPWIRTRQHVSRPPVGEEHRLSNAEVLTVFLDFKRDIAWIAKPGEALEMSLPVIQQMSGHADHLITPNPKWGQNVFPDAKYPEGPIGMIGGLPVEIVVHCHRTPKRDLGEDYDYWTGPTCYVLAAAQEMWSEKHESDRLGSQGVLYSYWTGIHITGEMDGTWEYFDLKSSILSFAALLVLLRLPKKLMTWISCRALGNLSKIYRGVVFQKFCIEEQVAGAAARILSHSASFREIEHTDGHGGLSNQGLHDALSYVARVRKKEDAPSPTPTHSVAMKTLTGTCPLEQENTVTLFSAFAFDAICNPMYRGHGLRSRFFRKVFGEKIMTLAEELLWCLTGESVVVHHEDSVKEERASRMSVDHFISAAISSEQVKYENLLLFFNVSRVIGPLERWFTPTLISKYFEQKHHENRLQTLWSQEAPAGDGMRDLGGVDPSTDFFGVSSRTLIKRLHEDLRHAREWQERLATATICPDRPPEGDLLADRPCALTDMPRLAQREKPATLSSTAANHARPPGQDPGDRLPALSPAAANHARPPGPEEGAEVRVEVNVLDSEMLRHCQDGDQAAVLGCTVADRARPPRHKVAQRAEGSAKVPEMDPELLGFWLEGCRLRWPGEGGPAVSAAAEGSELHRSRSGSRVSAHSVREQSPGATSSRSSTGRPVSRGAAGANAAADITRQPTGQG